MSEIKEKAPEGTYPNSQLDSITIREEMQAPEYIQPFKLSIMFKYANKIINQLVSIPDWLVNYDDIEFILEMVLDAVRKAKVKK